MASLNDQESPTIGSKSDGSAGETLSEPSCDEIRWKGRSLQGLDYGVHELEDETAAQSSAIKLARSVRETRPELVGQHCSISVTDECGAGTCAISLGQIKWHLRRKASCIDTQIYNRMRDDDSSRKYRDD